MGFVQGVPDSPKAIAAKKAARARIKAGEGFLYVAEIVGRDEIKIGFSLAPRRRMSTLRGYVGGDVRLLATMPGTLAEERSLHATLNAAAVPRRWRVPSEIYPRSILSHPAIPESLRSAA